jgi:hypothetical protein
VLRLCLPGTLDPKSAGAGMLALLARAADLPDFPALAAYVAETQRQVRDCFVRILGKMPWNLSRAGHNAWGSAITAASNVLGELAGESDKARKAHDSYTAFRDKISAWPHISIQAVLEARAG